LGRVNASSIVRPSSPSQRRGSLKLAFRPLAGSAELRKKRIPCTMHVTMSSTNARRTSSATIVRADEEVEWTRNRWVTCQRQRRHPAKKRVAKRAVPKRQLRKKRRAHARKKPPKSP